MSIKKDQYKKWLDEQGKEKSSLYCDEVLEPEPPNGKRKRQQRDMEEKCWMEFLCNAWPTFSDAQKRAIYREKMPVYPLYLTENLYNRGRYDCWKYYQELAGSVHYTSTCTAVIDTMIYRRTLKSFDQVHLWFFEQNPATGVWGLQAMFYGTRAPGLVTIEINKQCLIIKGPFDSERGLAHTGILQITIPLHPHQKLYIFTYSVPRVVSE